MKLNTLLALTEALSSSFRMAKKDFVVFFSKNQGDFKGVKKTYTPHPGTDDLPGERQFKKVVTTVGEKFEWFINGQKKYVQAIFDQEKTNATSGKTVNLTVGDVDFGNLTSLELLRLKSFLEENDLKEMIAQIPVRSDSENWYETDDLEYQGREVFQSKKIEGKKTTMDKESYILEDPNVAHLKDASGYKPQVAVKNTVRELGEYTLQQFSGEWSHKQRADLLKRRSDLHAAVVTALKEVNEAEVIESGLDAERLLNFLLKP